MFVEFEFLGLFLEGDSGPSAFAMEQPFVLDESYCRC